jgi:hypothetical protein
MIDLNYSLRIAYKAALDNLGVPVYYQSVPPNERPLNYVVFRSINNVDRSTKSTSDTTTTITVEIYTRQQLVNRGLDADTIARDVYNLIYPNRHDHLVIDGGQIVSTEVLGDSVQNLTLQSGDAMISRFIIFKHIIYQSQDIS